MKNLKHRMGAALIDFSVNHLLSPDVAKVFREQLDLGKKAIIQSQKVTVQLREDLRGNPSAAVRGRANGETGDLVCSCGWDPADHFTVESPEHACRLLKQHAREHNQEATSPGLPAPGTRSPNPDPTQLPEGI